MLPVTVHMKLYRRTYEVLYDNLMGLRDWEITLIRQAGCLKTAILTDTDRMQMSSIAWHDWKHPASYRWKPGKPCLIRLPTYVAQVLYLNFLSMPRTVGDELHQALIELDKRLTNVNLYHGHRFEMVH